MFEGYARDFGRVVRIAVGTGCQMRDNPEPASSTRPPMYTLYYSPGTASMVAHLALLEIGAPHRLELVDFDTNAQRDPDYLKLNPQGRVPTLIVDGKPVFESAALLMLLAERHPEARLAPAVGTPERAAWYQWIVYMANTLMPTYRLWFYPTDAGATEHPANVRAVIQGRIEGAFDLLDKHLSANGPYMLGEFSGVDLLLTMLMRWSRNMPKPATEWPALKTLADLVRVRASWKKLYEIEGLTDW
jgi:glutathione S-transferase